MGYLKVVRKSFRSLVIVITATVATVAMFLILVNIYAELTRPTFGANEMAIVIVHLTIFAFVLFLTVYIAMEEKAQWMQLVWVGVIVFGGWLISPTLLELDIEWSIDYVVTTPFFLYSLIAFALLVLNYIVVMEVSTTNRRAKYNVTVSQNLDEIKIKY